MAGRGRGRGGKPILPVIPDGGVKNEMPPPIFQPPPDFPPLECKPVPYDAPPDVKLLCQLRKNFVDYMADSEYYVKLDVRNNDIERFCDRNQEPEKKWENKVDWNWMPKYLQDEFKLTLKRHRIKEAKANGVSLKRPSKTKTSSSKRAKKDVDITTKLSELEKQEATHNSDEEDEKEEKDDEEDPEDLEEEVADEEMDEGTDYMNSYFDNGENYEEEEDNLDDGAIF